MIIEELENEELIAEVRFDEHRELEDFMEEMENDVFVKYGDITMNDIMNFTDNKEFKYNANEYNFRCQCVCVNVIAKAYGYKIKQFDNNITGVYKTEQEHYSIKEETSGVHVYVKVGDETFTGLVEYWGDEKGIMEIIEQKVNVVKWLDF